MSALIAWISLVLSFLGRPPLRPRARAALRPAIVRSRTRLRSNSAFCGAPQKAEFERDLIRERTGAGREAARKRGVRFGRPRKLSLDQEQLARRLVLEGKSASDI